MKNVIKCSLITSESYIPCKAAGIRIFLPCIISETLTTALKAEISLTWQHLAAVFLSPSAAFHMCNSILWDYPQLLPFSKPFPYRIVQMCLLSEKWGCQGDTARSTCSNDSVVIFAWFWMTFALFSPLSCLEACCNAVDLLTVSVSPPRDLIKKFLVIDRARRLGNMKVSWFPVWPRWQLPIFHPFPW